MPAAQFFGHLLKKWREAMLDIKLIRETPEIVREALRKRHMETDAVDSVLQLDDQRRSLILEVESRRSERNAVSKEIGRMKDAAARVEKIEAMRVLGDEITALDNQLKEVEEALKNTAAGIPNIPDADVPLGVDDKDNVVVKVVVQFLNMTLNPKRIGTWDLNWGSSILKGASS